MGRTSDCAPVLSSAQPGCLRWQGRSRPQPLRPIWITRITLRQQLHGLSTVGVVALADPTRLGPTAEDQTGSVSQTTRGTRWMVITPMPSIPRRTISRPG